MRQDNFSISAFLRKRQFVFVYGLVMFAFGMAVAWKAIPDLDFAPTTYVPEHVTAVKAGMAEPSDVADAEESYPPAPARVFDYKVKRGDTFSGILAKAGVGRDEAHHVSKALKTIFDPRQLKIGQAISVAFDKGEEEGALKFSALNVEWPERGIEVARKDDGELAARKYTNILERKLVRAEGEIRNTLSGLAASLHVPREVLAEITRTYSYDMDFQRDIRKGDHFAVLYEELYDKDGKRVRPGEVLYASMTVHGRDLEVYRFAPRGDDPDYFTTEGRTIRKDLMRTPLDGAVISSPFGMRKHPISGYNILHKGVDFAAPYGTPIYAAGDGVIEYIGRNGGYGNYVRVRHGGGFSTAYAHLKGFSRGIKKGSRVKQGQVIAYLGSTGNSTGPHLHFEILKGDKQVNPLQVQIPSGRKLSGSALSAFNQQKESVARMFADQPSSAKLALR